jgi:hypothetical protein
MSRTLPDLLLMKTHTSKIQRPNTQWKDWKKIWKGKLAAFPKNFNMWMTNFFDLFTQQWSVLNIEFYMLFSFVLVTLHIPFMWPLSVIWRSDAWRIFTVNFSHHIISYALLFLLECHTEYNIHMTDKIHHKHPSFFFGMWPHDPKYVCLPHELLLIAVTKCTLLAAEKHKFLAVI